MLRHLQVQNIALIEAADLDFAGGLQVITGETGAGKSLLIDALQLALGGRADAGLLRTGAQAGGVQALFSLDDAPAAVTWLIDNQLDDGEEVLLSRELTTAGRNLCRINGTMVTLTQLRALGLLLVDVHTQHESQSLLTPARHAMIFDRYIGEDHVARCWALGAAVRAWRAAVREGQQGDGDPAERERRLALLQHDIDTIAALDPKQGEDERLAQQRLKLVNTQRLANAVQGAFFALYEGGDEQQSAIGLMQVAAKELDLVQEFDPGLGAAVEALNGAIAQAEEAAFLLRDRTEEEEMASLEAIEQRLSDLSDAKRRYGGDLEGVLAHQRACQEQVDDLLAGESNAAQRREKVAELLRDALQLAGQVSAARHKASGKLTQAIDAQLRQVGLPGARFSVAIDTPPESDWEKALTAEGVDALQFCFSANPGEPGKPLARIASGGEVSRIMLALKCVLSSCDDIPTLVFDEIDAGISGRVAQAVAEKLCRLAGGRQIFCVSHMPQMAAMADAHWLVEKAVRDGRTASRIRTLDGPDRQLALAAMTSGAEPGATAIAHAKTLLAEAEKIRETRGGGDAAAF